MSAVCAGVLEHALRMPAVALRGEPVGGFRFTSPTLRLAVFSITPDGTETVIYSFQGGSDGATPSGKLLDVDGALYGTTFMGGLCPNYGGGANGCGTVFSITP
jgi:hypothetical protein